MYIYTCIFLYVYFQEIHTDIHRVYTIVYFPGIPPKQAKFCLRVGSSAGLQGKRHGCEYSLRIFLPNPPIGW